MKKNVVLMLACTLLLSSCIYWGMYHFSNDDRVWLSPYDEGDTILFKSVTNEMDTLIVNEKYVKDTYWPFMENEARNVMKAYGFLDMDIWHKSQPFHFGLSITKEKSDGLSVSLPLARIRGFSWESEIKMEEKQIGHESYKDVFVCTEKDARFFLRKEPGFQYYLWSKSKGLLQYKYLNGEVYTFYKKIPCKRKY